MKKVLTVAFAVLAICSAWGKGYDMKRIVNGDVNFSARQYMLMEKNIARTGKTLIPKTVKDGKVKYIPIDDWCSGFYAGSLWYLNTLTGNRAWKPLAERYTLILDSVKHLKWHHDVGFMIGCSYLNGYRLGGHKEYKDVIVETARSLCTRFRPNAGVIQSWNVDRGWQSQRGWTCPVIIDNMMNLELLFEATRMSGDSTFWNIAVQHANTTMANHFRTDYSCYHVIDYDPATGKVLNKHTAQGYAHETSWARGQAWAIYGFTVCYRYTRDKRYLDLAQKVLNFILKNKNMPKDLVPYWDYDAPNIPNEPRDASSAACVASALYEMDVYLPGNNYRSLANRMLRSLSTPAYRAPLGKNGCFLLMHSVGSIPHNNEIDVPLNYADYYFLEVLMRQRKAPKF